MTRTYVRHTDLCPWRIERQHYDLHHARMLRALGRRRAGLSNVREIEIGLDNWLDRLEQNSQVVDYDPEAGFRLVKRRKSDADIIRKPSKAKAAAK